MRAPSSLNSLLVLRELINAVISTACALCMIMPCMNSTSFGEEGGNLARVDEGSFRVGCPGAPGWTTTGCCARTGNVNMQRTAPGVSKDLRCIGNRVDSGVATNRRDFIGVEYSSVEG